MKNRLYTWITGIPVILLIPYLFTIIFNGLDTALVNRSPDVETCLPAVISLQISPDYELETIKSQAVIARTNLYRRIDNNETLFNILRDMRDTLQRTYEIDFFPSGVYEKAAEDTKGQVLIWQGELKLIPYHQISGGTTRDGEEVFHDKEYAYLKSVDSSGDKKSPEYLNSSYIAAQQMPKELTIETRDKAGYIMELSADGNPLEGEAFRQGMGLSSANFTVQKIGDKFRFLCKGKGHGLGFSQYGGNELAKAGSTSQEILETYFPGMELQDINSIFTKK
ncbi:MAG: SpoIID/LytB domain-containing protein [Eubacteriales bacterium]|nr:SpoIID/LytB domain-containing protein [Eubacteriales bacterium]